MKIVDKYVLKGFLFSFAVVFVAMMALTIMVDMVLNLDQFMSAAPGDPVLGAWKIFGHIISYYFYRSFEYFQWLSGAALLVGGAFAIARLNKTNELTALKASGVSVYRILWPIIVGSVVISLLYVVDQELCLPNMVEQLTGDRSMAGGPTEFEVNYVEDGHNSLLYAPKFSPKEQTMKAKFTEDPVTHELVRVHAVQISLRDKTARNLGVIEADAAVYDKSHGGWQLKNGWYQPYPQAGETPPQEKTAAGQAVNFYATEIDPTALERQKRSEFFNYLSFGETRKLLGSSQVNAPVVEVAMHKHFAKPILNIVLLLLGLPFIVGQEGKSYLLSVMFCIGVFVLVLGVEYVAVEFGGRGDLPPALAAYLPVFIFTPVAILTLDNVRT
jgi:lipopolysaccharide export system permease protein